ncbi:uroporphyrinogen decarboxylase [Candidatus Latescibacterota bacterium]
MKPAEPAAPPATLPAFLQACRGHVPDVRPIWLMRQAGRILKPYRDLKDKVGSIEALFRTPELAAQVTLMPVEMLGVDAAILFADIFTPVEPMGIEVTFAPGPVLAGPLRDRRQAEALRIFDPHAELAGVMDTVRLIRSELPPSVPLIGFAGAPFTLATYLAEGGGAKEFTHLRRLLRTDRDTALLMMDRLTEVCIAYLQAQVAAGAQAIQVFDTWIGALSRADFADVALPYLQRIFASLESVEVPRIYYANGASHLVDMLDQVGADVLSLDWRVDLAEVRKRLDGRRALQGNLDPCALFGSPEDIDRSARSILDSTASFPHIFNLGHGVLPDTPVDNVRRLVDTVHAYERQEA